MYIISTQAPNVMSVPWGRAAMVISMDRVN